MTSLNAEQQEVVQHGSGPMRVGAVAGAGKTTALIERVAYLVTKRNVPIEKILLISFSKAAREEMLGRLKRRLPHTNPKGCVRTFHSIGLMIFQKEGDPKRIFEIDTSGLLWIKATEIAYRKLGMEPERSAITQLAGRVKNKMLKVSPDLHRLGKIDPRLKLEAQLCCTTQMSDPRDLINAFYASEKVRTEQGVSHKGAHGVRFVTFDDMIYQTALLLQRDDVRDRWATRWQYILGDEAQDENEAQSRIAEALASKTKNYMIVGDPSQSIYGFRGSSPENMLSFDAKWPGSKTVVMFRNYRSGVGIVDLANRIMGHMPATTVITDEIGDSYPMYSERQTKSYIGCHVFPDALEEAESVACNIHQHRQDGITYGDQAVLVRMNRMTRDIEVALARKSIPYRLVSGQSFFLSIEARTLFGYLQVLAARAGQDAFKACISNPSRRLGRAFVSEVGQMHDMVKRDWMLTVEKAIPKLSGWHRTQAVAWLGDMQALQHIRGGKPADALATLRRQFKLDAWFGRNVGDGEDSRSSDTLDAVVDFARSFGSVRDLLDATENVERHRALNTRKRDAVTISTVHKAKGHEWQVVYLMQVGNNLFPTGMGDADEERRCFYVACTRAMDELWISRPAEAMDSGGDVFGIQRSTLVEEVELTEDDHVHYPLGKAVDPQRIGTQIGMVFQG